MRSVRWLFPALVAVAACSADEGGAPSGPLSSTQDQWDEAAFLAATDGDGDVAALRDALAADGLAAFVTAGALGDETARLEFAEYSDGAGALAAVVRHCQATDCVRAIARLGDDGQVAWTDGAGQPVKPRTVALPPLLREVSPGADPTKTSVVSPLQDVLSPLAPADVDLTANRLIVANQFASDLGLAAADLAKPFASSRRFSTTVLRDRVGAADLERFLQTAHSHEVLVVAGQPVRKLRRQDKDPANNWYQTLGIEASTGIYGFSPVDATRLSAALHGAPLGGPGLVLLVGSESISDGSEEVHKQAGSIPYEMRFPGKVVAGFVKGAHPSVLVSAARSFLARLEAGDTAGAARDAVNTTLAGWGVPARLGFTIDSDDTWRLPGPRASFWPGGKAPTTGVMDLVLHLRMYCADQWGVQRAVREDQAKATIEGLAFDGPVFHATMDVDYFEPGVVYHYEVVGLLDELRVGGHFRFVFQGDVKKEYRGLTIYGNAQVTRIVDQGGKRIVYFGGGADTLGFTGPDGRACTLPDTDVGPLVEGTDSSKLALTF